MIKIGESVGSINLDLNVNQNNFNKQMNSITSLAKSAGKALAGAFAVGKLIEFGKSCLELSSDLAEVQNVVDVTFTNMANQVNEFAQSAAFSFGLSETMAKRYVGVFGAMAKAFGFTEKEAYDMSTTLTGLAGDVASFYNISQDEAYIKLKGVFTGESEPLKDLGIVMTDTSLEAYALATGIGKTMSKMTEAEKVSLRYQFVQEQLALATGDFARTSDGWANQIRILSLQFDSFKASIGQGLINIFTPVIKSINSLLGKLITLGNAFKSFTELITGKKADTGNTQVSTITEDLSSVTDSASEVIEDLSNATNSANNLSNATKNVGTSAKKASKEMKSLMGFDEINKLSENSDNSSGDGDTGDVDGSNGNGLTSVPIDDVDFGSLAEGDTAVDELSEKFDKLIKKFKKLGSLFVKGFKLGLGDLNFKSIQDSIDSIKVSLSNVFTNVDVITSANEFVETLVFNLGKCTGSIASIGVTIATNLLGGIAKYLKDNEEFIQNRIISLFKIGTKVSTIIGDLFVSIADIFTVFANSDGIEITEGLIEIFSNGVLGIVELLSQLGADILYAMAQPIINNKNIIKTALENTLKPLKTVVTSIASIVTNTFKKVSEVYNTYISPAFENIISGLSTIFSAILDGYNKYLAPVFDWITKRFSKVVSDYIQPLIDSVLELCGKIIEVFSMLWDYFSSFIGWFIKKFIAKLATKIQWLWTKIEVLVSSIAIALKGIIDILNGIIDFVVGVFTGDWNKAWNGIKEIFNAIWNTIKSLVKVAINFVKNTIITVLNDLKGKIEIIWDGICLVFSKAWDVIKNIFSGMGKWFSKRWNDVKNVFSNVDTWFKEKFSVGYNKIKEVFLNLGKWFGKRWNDVKNVFSNVDTWFKEKFSVGYNKIKEVFSNLGEWFGKRWNDVKNVFSNVDTWFSDKFSKSYKNITIAFKGVGTFFSDVWKSIKNTFSNVSNWFEDVFSKAWEKVKAVFSTGGKIFDGIKDGILNGLKAVINAIIGGINKVIEVPFNGLNSAIRKLRNLDIMGLKPFDWIGEFSVPQIPRLAQGGYVKANTPQLAMIGDNRHQGEIVSPENKLTEMAIKAVKMAGTNNDFELIELLKQLICIVKNKDIDIYLDGKEITKNVINNINRTTLSFGKSPILI